MKTLDDYLGHYVVSPDYDELFHVVKATPDDDLDSFHVEGLAIGDNTFWRVSRRAGLLRVSDRQEFGIFTIRLAGSQADHVAALTPPELAEHAWHLALDALRGFRATEAARATQEQVL
jgi:hypothetical protein